MKIFKIALFIMSFSLTPQLYAEESSTVIQEKHYLSQEMLSSLVDILTTQSFMAEFEFEKNKTRTNEQGIENLEDRIESIIENFSMAITELSKNQQESAKRGNENTNIKNNLDPKEIEKIKKDISEIKRALVALSSRIENPKDTPKPKLLELDVDEYIIGVDICNIKDEPQVGAKTIYTLKKGDRVKILECNRFGWCKMERGGYIAKYKLVKQ